MTLLTLVDASLSLGYDPVLENAHLSVSRGERLGLIGRNGSGKSTLLKVLDGQVPLERGDLHRQQGLRCAYMAQESVFATGLTVREAVALGVADVRDDVEAYIRGEGDLALLQSRIESRDGWNWERAVEASIAEIGVSATARVDELSGGGRKRVALAQALVSRPDLLLMDEPTNHLDLETIRWLEERLLKFEGSLLVVTHDRSFLNRVVTRIVELDRGRLTSFPGNFDQYRETKEAMLAAEALANERADKLLAQEEIWIRKGVEARRTRSQSRVHRLEALRRQRQERRETLGRVRLEVDRGIQSGKVVVEMDNVSHAFGTQTIVSGLTCTVLRGDRLGVLGPNGAGKTSLLRLMLGDLAPQQGQVKRGTRLSVAYFDQMRAALDLEATLEDFVSPGSEWIELAGRRQHVRSYLADFLFDPARVRQPVRMLSGGERNRLLLARLFAQPANVLVLDEPTNDLDIETLDLLEATLAEYAGTVFVVSHDRSFLDQVVTSTLVAQGDGRWLEYEGNVQDWLVQAGRAAAVAGGGAALPRAPDALGAAKSAGLPAQRPAERQKLTYRERQELETLPGRIDALEREQADIRTRLADGSLYASDHLEAARLARRDEEIEQELMAALERWQALEARTAGP